MQIICGADEHQNRTHLQKCLLTDQAAGRRAIILVPEQFTLQSECRLLTMLDRDASIDIVVRSFGALAREVLGRTGGLYKPWLNDAGRRMLLKRMIEGETEPLHFLAQAVGQRGMTERILQTLVELRNENVSIGALKEATDELTGQPLMCRKIDDVALLLESYADAISDHYLDSEGRLQLLAEQLPKAEWLHDVHFYVTAFHDMNALETDVLRVLAMLGVSLKVFLVFPQEVRMQHPDRNPTFQSSRRFLRRLQAIAPQATCVSSEGDSTAPPDLQVLARQLFAIDAVRPANVEDPHVQVVRSVSTEQEVTYLAATIRRQVIEEGKRYRDFNIAVTNTAEYLPLVRRIFLHHDIPTFIDARRSMVENPVVRMLLNALRMAEEDMPMDAVMAFLHSGMVPVAQDDVMAFEAHIRAWRLRGKRFFDAHSFDPAAIKVPYGKKKTERITQRMVQGRRIADCLRALFADLYPLAKEMQPMRAFARALYHFSSQPLLLEGMTAFQASCEAEGKDDVAAENRQVFDVLAELLDQLVETMGEEVATFSDFVSVMRAGLEETTIGIIPPARDQVQVGALGRMRSEGIRCQIIIGLSDQWMPSPVQERTIFSEQEKAELAGMGIVFPSYGERLVEEEYLSFYEAVLRPQEMLILSHAMRDQAHAPLHPSAVIRRTLQVFPEVKEKSALQALQDLLLYSPPLAMREAMAMLRAQRQQLDEAPSMAQPRQEALGIFRFYQEQDGVQGAFLRAGFFYDNRRFPLRKDDAKRLYLGPASGRISITQLETMRACPYRHFVQYGLRPEEADTFEIESRDFGTILHNALDRLTADLKDAPQILKESDDAIYARMDQYLLTATEATLDSRRRTESRNRAILRKVRRDAHKAGKHIVRQLNSSAFHPVAQEVPFGDGQTLPALTLSTPEGDLRLEGRIDRIDAWKAHQGLYLSVIDYKTFNKDFALGKLLDGLNVQLMMYLQAALGWDDDAMPAGMFYLSLKAPFIETASDDPAVIEMAVIEQLLLEGILIDDDVVQEAMDMGNDDGKKVVVRFKDRSLSPELMSDLMAFVNRQCEQTVAEILQGTITVLPASYDNAVPCSFCTFGSLCRINDITAHAQRRIVPKVKMKDLASALEEEAMDGEL